MKDNFQNIAKTALAAEDIFHVEDIQSLWSGYGKIMRYGLSASDQQSVVIKHVKLPDKSHHPRGWNTDLSHLRKIRSYHVESGWYRNWSHHCGDACRVPHCYALDEDEDEFLMVLEDLDANGFPVRKQKVTLDEMKTCLSWLANFHATFMQQRPTGLWRVGTYWHLDTRPDELHALADNDLKAVAGKLDQVLSAAQYQTFVHGDAKLANFCFSQSGKQVAAVDFQYVGGGCGIKDVAYFIGSCLYEDECELHEQALLNHYFNELAAALSASHSQFNLDQLLSEWRDLYPLAWTDFHRFMKGWSPGHWKIHSYSERLARQVIEQLMEMT